MSVTPNPSDLTDPTDTPEVAALTAAGIDPNRIDVNPDGTHWITLGGGDVLALGEEHEEIPWWTGTLYSDGEPIQVAIVEGENLSAVAADVARIARVPSA
jgi:streptogramin lyase